MTSNPETSPFSVYEQTLARHVLLPWDRDGQLPGLLESTERVATIHRQSLVTTALDLRGILSLPERPVIVVAGTWGTADHYIRFVRGCSKTHKVIIEPDRLQGYSQGTKAVVVDDGGRLRTGMLDHLTVGRFEVEWVNLDTLAGVDRARG